MFGVRSTKSGLPLVWISSPSVRSTDLGKVGSACFKLHTCCSLFYTTSYCRHEDEMGETTPYVDARDTKFRHGSHGEGVCHHRCQALCQSFIAVQQRVQITWIDEMNDDDDDDDGMEALNQTTRLPRFLFSTFTQARTQRHRIIPSIQRCGWDVTVARDLPYPGY